MADRFYCPDLSTAAPIRLLGDEAKHLARVARREVGEVVEVFDGHGFGVEARIEAIGKDRVDLRPLGLVVDREAPLTLHLLVAPPKGDRFDWLVEKAVEIGVARLVPLRAGRSVVDPRISKLDRLRRLVVEACKQCGRNRLMEIAEPVASSDAFGSEAAAVRLIAEAGGLPSARIGARSGATVALAIGPEGGWTASEREDARGAGWIEMGLGATRLRVETAALVGASILFSGAGEPAP